MTTGRINQVTARHFLSEHPRQSYARGRPPGVLVKTRIRRDGPEAPVHALDIRPSRTLGRRSFPSDPSLRLADGARRPGYSRFWARFLSDRTHTIPSPSGLRVPCSSPPCSCGATPHRVRRMTFARRQEGWHLSTTCKSRGKQHSSCSWTAFPGSPLSQEISRREAPAVVTLLVSRRARPAPALRARSPP